jgi:pyruvate ferredoxin oxidoreductase gamma subunit
VRTIDATGIALEIIGRPIVNTTLLGAFAGATGEISLESIKRSVLTRFPGKIGEVNVQAAEKASQLIAATERKPHKKTRARKKGNAVEKSERLHIGAIGRPGTSEVTMTGDWRVFYPEFDIEHCTRWCTRCGKCLENCPDAAIRERLLSGADTEEALKRADELEKAGKIKKAHIQYDVQYELYLMYCKGCGICANECPTEGIKMKLEEK